MILSVSRRTDIPTFYSDWFFNRVKDGNVCVRNPMNKYQVSRVKITPDVVDCIVFWSKDPKPMLSRLDELKDYKYYFQFTLNGYDSDLEPHLSSVEERIDTFQKLSDKIGSKCVIWRYDPIVFTDKYSADCHLKKFGQIAESLYGYTNKVVISFVDVYGTKNKTNLNAAGYKPMKEGQLNEFAKSLAEIARANGMEITTCAEAIDLDFCGIKHNSCIDQDLIESIIGYPIKVKADGQREACGCVKCEDIGTYNTCLHGCRYCYANYKDDQVKEMYARYDVDSPILCDVLDERVDKITDRPVKSLRDGSKMAGQMSLF